MTQARLHEVGGVLVLDVEHLLIHLRDERCEEWAQARSASPQVHPDPLELHTLLSTGVTV